MNRKGEVAYNYWDSNYLSQVYAGAPSSPQPVPGLSMAAVTGINRAGTLVGIDQASIGGQTVGALFIDIKGRIKQLVPPEGSLYSESNIVINDLGQIAGAYKDAGGTVHGFTYTKGEFTSFDMPTKSDAIAISGINNRGRVVGIFADAKTGTQRGFLYNGSEVKAFGEVQSSEDATVVINDLGVMVFSFFGTGNSFAAYRMLCAGPGC
jgi:probable HAF family extracellular repeat protein